MNEESSDTYSLYVQLEDVADDAFFWSDDPATEFRDYSDGEDLLLRTFKVGPGVWYPCYTYSCTEEGDVIFSLSLLCEVGQPWVPRFERLLKENGYLMDDEESLDFKESPFYADRLRTLLTVREYKEQREQTNEK